MTQEQNINAEPTDVSVPIAAEAVTDPGSADNGFPIVGIALLPPRGSDMIAILQAADAALYVAQAGGRNSVRLAQSG